MPSPRLPLLALLAALSLPSSALAANAQSWVSGVGDDANTCTMGPIVYDPCKTFAGGLAATAPDGIVSALDPGNFGPFTVTQGVTIDGSGTFSAVIAPTDDGIVVNAPGQDVVLRGLAVQWGANGPCSAAGTGDGIRIVAARSVLVDGVTVRGFPGAGIAVAPSADGTTVTVRDSHLADNCTAGLDARRPGGSVAVTLLDSVVSNNPTGIRAGAGSAVRIARNTVTANATGLVYEAGGTLDSNGDNRVAGNITDGSPTPAPPPPPAPAPTPTPETPNGTPAPDGGGQTPPVTPAAQPCVVPRVIGLTYVATVRRLYAAGCRLGKVRYRYSRAHRRYRMYRQDVRAGIQTAPLTEVGVTISAKPARSTPVATTADAGYDPIAWASGVGDDVNPCSRTAPCKTFAGTIVKTGGGGTLAMVDPGGFGGVTITQPVTIDGGASMASGLVSSGTNGIVINAGPTADVTLRNLVIEYTAACSAPGANGIGIRVVSAHVVRLENVVVRGFPNAGLLTDASSAAHVVVDHSSFTDNCTAGINAAGAPTDVTVVDSNVSGSATGVAATSGATVRLGGNRIANTTTAFSRTGTGVLQSWGDQLLGNAADGATPDPLTMK